MTKTKMNKNLIIQLLTREVEQLRAMETYDQATVKALRMDCEEFIEDRNQLRDVLCKVEEDRDSFHSELLHAQDSLDRLYDELRELKHENDQLTQANTHLNHEIGEASQNAYDVVNRLSDQLHYAHQEARNAEDKLRNSTVSLDALQFLLNRDRVRKEKINAIKTVRKITDCGLRDAKEFVEAYIDGNLAAEPNDLGSILASALK